MSRHYITVCFKVLNSRRISIKATDEFKSDYSQPRITVGKMYGVLVTDDMTVEEIVDLFVDFGSERSARFLDGKLKIQDTTRKCIFMNDRVEPSDVVKSVPDLKRPYVYLQLVIDLG